MLTDILQLVVYGTVLGSILTLGAIGVSLTYGILRFAHFAHGDMMTLGAYFALSLVAALKLPVYVALPFAMVATVISAVMIDRVIYRRLRQTDPVILLISSFGMAMALRAAVQLIWGPHNQVYEEGIQIPHRIAGIVIKPDHIVIVAGALALVVALNIFLQKTRTGKAMRAMADNPELARITGIDNEKIIFWTWVLGGGMAGAAGVFLAQDTQLTPVMGWQILLPVFAAAIIGGIGKPYGAIAGGFIIGISMEVSTIFIDPVYKHAVAFALMVLTLIIRPTGLFGGR